MYNYDDIFIVCALHELLSKVKMDALNACQ